MTTFLLGDEIVHSPSGTRGIFRSLFPANQDRPAFVRYSPLGRENEQAGWPLAEVEAAPTRSVRGGFERDTDILPRVWGWKPWAHVEEVDLLSVVNNIASGAGSAHALNTSGRFLVPGTTHPEWARFYLDQLQGGGWSGVCTVLVYGRAAYRTPPELIMGVVHEARQLIARRRTTDDGELAADERYWAALETSLANIETTDAQRPHTAWKPAPRAFRVWVCKHEYVTGGNANPNRGWHPASCAKCGMDLSVDSSD